MKKIVLSMLSLLFIFVFMLPQLSHAATGSSDIPLYLNGKKLMPEISPQLVGNTSIVPIRIISEELGGKVTWSQTESKVTIRKGQTVIQLWINKKDAQVNGKSYLLEEAPRLIAGNTLVPVRLVAENMGIQVKWDNNTRSVVLIKAADTTTPDTKPVQPPPVVTPEVSNPNGYPELRSIVLTGNQLQVQASGSITPKVFYLSNPDRLVMDIPASTFSKTVPKPLPNTMVEIPTNNPLVSKIRYAFNDPATATIRIVIELKAKAGYKIADNGLSGKVAVDIAEAKYKVVIDPGHGDQDPGAKSLTGKKEKDFNLAMALKVQKLLQQNPSIQVTMTRSTDVFIPLSGRVTIADNAGADIFVSIHANSWMAASRGTETYYNRADSTSLAGVIQSNMVAATGFPNRGVKFGDFHVIRETSMPAVLLEVGYLSNAIEDAAMANEDFRNRVAASVANGIKEYLKVN
jgi:N-acetylmuramoyl-L-alanine amidase